MKKIFTCILAFCLVVSIAGCADNAGTNNPGGSGTTAATSEPDKNHETTGNNSETTADSSETTDNNAGSNEKISLKTQLYEGENIVEIPAIEYGGENSELEAINNMITQGIQSEYEKYINGEDSRGWIEIKSYPFTTDEYLQVVITHIVYPNYATDGNIESINYDRNAKKWLKIEDALAMIDMTEESVGEKVGTCDIPGANEATDEKISDVEISGFLIEGESVILLLNLTMINNEGSEREALYSLDPNGDTGSALTKLDNSCIFDPYNMDEMDPPLWYQKNADAEQES